MREAPWLYAYDRDGIDLIVDASGRGSRTPKWLESLGYPRPESRVWTSRSSMPRIYRRPQVPWAWKALYVLASLPVSTRIGVIAPIEGDRWITTLTGRIGDHPPDDEAGFLEFARGLPAATISSRSSTKLRQSFIPRVPTRGSLTLRPFVSENIVSA